MVAKQNAVRALRRRQADRREAAETALLEATISLIAARGVKGTTLADVGEAAGYSRGLAAHYYKTKDRLLQATAEYIGEQYVRLLHEKSDATGMKVLVSYVELTCMPRRLEIAKAMHVMHKEALFDTSGLQAIFSKHSRLALKRLENNIRIGIENGEIRKDVDPKAEAAILLAMGRGVRTLWLHSPDKINPLKLKQDILDFLHLNLAAKAR